MLLTAMHKSFFVYTIFGGIFGKKGTLLSFIVAIIFTSWWAR